MTDFQSEFVFGLQGKRYQDFITDIAMPEISKVLGTNDYEVVGFDGHLSFKDFENKKNSIASHIYMNFLKDIIKDEETGKVSFTKKVCVTLDERLCNDNCPNTGRRIAKIKLANVDLAYFIYFNVKEFFDFVYDSYSNPFQHEITPIISSTNIPKIDKDNADFNDVLSISKTEKNIISDNDKNEKSIYKSFSELAVLRKDKLDDNQIEGLNNQNDNEFKEITGYIHNHNFEREFSFIRISSDSDEGYPISNRDFPDLKVLKIGTPIVLILEKDSFSNEFNIVDFKPCSYDDLDFVERFKGTLKRISDKRYAIIKNDYTSVFVPPYLAKNFDEEKIYNVECVAVESFDRKKGQMGWEALDVEVCN